MQRKSNPTWRFTFLLNANLVNTGENAFFSGRGASIGNVWTQVKGHRNTEMTSVEVKASEEV